MEKLIHGSCEKVEHSLGVHQLSVRAALLPLQGRKCVAAASVPEIVNQGRVEKREAMGPPARLGGRALVLRPLPVRANDAVAGARRGVARASSSHGKRKSCLFAASLCVLRSPDCCFSRKASSRMGCKPVLPDRLHLLHHV